LQEKKKEMQY